MMHDLDDFNGYQSILCLNGELPDTHFFLDKNLPVIAADGAANQLYARGIPLTLIIGDLDSVHPSILEQYPYLRFSSQNSNDYQKAMRYLKEKELLPAIITGSSGGFLDHILNNINIFMETDSLLYSPPVRGMVVREGTTRRWSFPLGTKISIMGIPDAVISSRGLKWELNRSQLTFPGASSCFNRSASEEIQLEIHHGRALILIYDTMVSDAGSLL